MNQRKNLDKMIILVSGIHKKQVSKLPPIYKFAHFLMSFYTSNITKLLKHHLTVKTRTRRRIVCSPFQFLDKKRV